MKKTLIFMITATLMLTTVSPAFARSNNNGEKNNQQITQNQEQKQDKKSTKKSIKKSKKETKMEFKIKGARVIKNGRYKLPVKPITKGMGATVEYAKDTEILTIVKDANTIVIDFEKKIVTVNGVVDTESGIFTAKNSKKMTVLIKYIANVFGIRVSCDKDEIVVTVPNLNVPTNVTVTPVGTSVVANTLNNSTLYMTAAATITAGQATGGKAELYVGKKLVATDSSIAATDTEVQFTTADATPSTSELQAAIPTGGVVTVKLYNAANKAVTSVKANPTLVVDYVAPAIANVTAATYNKTNNTLLISTSGAAITVSGSAITADKVDVTKISLFDASLGKTYQLTNALVTGSFGFVNNENLLVINIGSADKLALADFGTSAVFMNVAAGSLLSDMAGNTSAAFNTIQTVPVTIIK
ncbi:MAG: stalk domain-containing protein [Mobilitalea sp.]